MQEVAQSMLAPLAAIARLLEPAERRVHIARLAIEGEPTRADPASNAIGTRQVIGPDIRLQTVFSVVGDPDRLLLRLIRQDGQQGPEDLLASKQLFVFFF